MRRPPLIALSILLRRIGIRRSQNAAHMESIERNPVQLEIRLSSLVQMLQKILFCGLWLRMEEEGGFPMGQGLMEIILTGFEGSLRRIRA